MKRWTRAIAVSVLISFAATSMGCAYVLHPERRGNPPTGRIGGLMLFFDILWLLAFIVPGVVFLVVDFTSGAIYVRGGYAMQIGHDGNVAVQLPASDKPQTYEVRLVGENHEVLVRQNAFVAASIQDPAIGLHVDDQVRRSIANGQKVYLEISGTQGTARTASALAVAQ